MKKIILILLLLVSVLSAQKDARFDSLVSSGIYQIYGLQFEQAEETFKSVLTEYPDHPAGKFYEAMILWWKIIIDFSNTQLDEAFIDQVTEVVDYCDEILDEDPDNLDALFFKGGALGFRGRLYAFRKNWFDAAMDGKDALPLVYRAYEVDPTNKDVQLGFGIYNYYAAAIPEHFPIVEPFMIFFPEGDKEKGIEQLKLAAREGKYSKFEARYTLTTLLLNFEERPAEAMIFAKQLVNDFPDNPAFQRYYGRIYVKAGNYNQASVVFEDIIAKCDSGMPGYSSWIKREALYYIGMKHYRKAEYKEAKSYFEECRNLSISLEIDRDEETGFFINSTLHSGNIEDRIGSREKALKYYEEVLDMREYKNSHEKAEQYIGKKF
ncbi:MAG: hypothetical protein SCALA702_22990 [Melioribacteraceae bacterium]|nr:MAG: hypothetical protein SCALA702_22990 [Melioribacteraceae bacterium]